MFRAVWPSYGVKILVVRKLVLFLVGSQVCACVSPSEGPLSLCCLCLLCLQHRNTGPSPNNTPARTWDRTRIRTNEHSSFRITTILTLDDGQTGETCIWRFLNELFKKFKILIWHSLVHASDRPATEMGSSLLKQFLSWFSQCDKGVLLLVRAGLGTLIWVLDEELLRRCTLHRHEDSNTLKLTKKILSLKFWFHFEYPQTYPYS
jgi:hypothetical protein